MIVHFPLINRTVQVSHHTRGGMSAMQPRSKPIKVPKTWPRAYTALPFKFKAIFYLKKEKKSWAAKHVSCTHALLKIRILHKTLHQSPLTQEKYGFKCIRATYTWILSAIFAIDFAVMKFIVLINLTLEDKFKVFVYFWQTKIVRASINWHTSTRVRLLHRQTRPWPSAHRTRVPKWVKWFL